MMLPCMYILLQTGYLADLLEKVITAINLIEFR